MARGDIAPLVSPQGKRSFNWLLTGVTVLDAAYCWMDSADWGCRRGYVQLCFTGRAEVRGRTARHQLLESESCLQDVLDSPWCGVVDISLCTRDFVEEGSCSSADVFASLSFTTLEVLYSAS